MAQISGLRERVIARLERSGRYRQWVLITALAGMFATTFPITILTVSLGDIGRDFGVSETLMTWVISAPLLASAVSLPVLGKMGDVWGHRRVFLTGFVLATVVAALTAGAWSAFALIGFRTVAQVIGAATQPTSMALIMGVYDRKDRVKAMGWWSLVAAGAPAVGLVAGGPLIDLLGWRLLFIIQSGLAFIAVAVATVVLGETVKGERVRFDVAGALTLAAGTGGLMVILSQGREWGWTHPAVLVAAVVGPLGLAAFVRAERGADDPLLPLEYFQRRNFTFPIIASLFSGAAYMGGFILAPLLMRFVFDYSLSATALIMVTRPLTYSLSSPLGGQVGTRLGERSTAMLGTGLIGAALALFSVGALQDTVELIFVALLMQGLGNGFARPSLTASLANSVEERNLGIAAAAQRMIFQVGASFGITVMTVVYAGVNTAGAFARAYVVGAAIAGAAVVAAFFIRSEVRGEVPEPALEPGETSPEAGETPSPGTAPVR